MKHLFVAYHLAVLAKEKGFDEPCFGYYKSYNKEFHEFLGSSKQKIDSNIQAPLYQQLIDFFREKHNIYISVTKYYGGHGFYLNKNRFTRIFIDGYYEALNKALEESFKLI